MRQARAKVRRAFTLIEMLTVIAILMILLAILLPALMRARESARATATRALLASLGNGLEGYRADVGMYPAKDYFYPGGPVGDVGPYTMNPGGYGFNRLAQALTGMNYAGSDGIDGLGFRMMPKIGPQVFQGRVYGPYVIPTSKNFKVFFTAQDLPNPTEPTVNVLVGTPPWNGREYQASGANFGFVDSRGQPIFYFPSGNLQASSGIGPLFDLPYSSGYLLLGNSGGGGGRGTLFGAGFNPTRADAGGRYVTATLSYSYAGGTTPSRLFAYTPPGYWDSRTPEGPEIATWQRTVDGGTVTYASDVGYGQGMGVSDGKGAIEWRRKLGMSNPANVEVQTNDRIPGRYSYLLIAPGPDRQYYTRDDIISDWQN